MSIAIFSAKVTLAFYKKVHLPESFFTELKEMINKSLEEPRLEDIDFVATVLHQYIDIAARALHNANEEDKEIIQDIASKMLQGFSTHIRKIDTEFYGKFMDLYRSTLIPVDYSIRNDKATYEYFKNYKKYDQIDDILFEKDIRAFMVERLVERMATEPELIEELSVMTDRLDELIAIDRERMSNN